MTKRPARDDADRSEGQEHLNRSPSAPRNQPPSGDLPDGPRTPEEERVADALMRLVADRAFEDLDSEDPRNARFFDWFAREARNRQTPNERAEQERRAKEFAERMTRRWREDLVGVTDVPGSPPLRTAPAETSIASALERAAESHQAPYLDLAVAAGEGRELWDEVCAEWVDLPANLPRGRHIALRVAGDSMTPLLHEGDTILVRVCESGERPEPGRVVVARRPDSGYVVKRLGRVGARELELLSLNAAYPPVRVPRRRGALLGTVVLRWCAHDSRSQ